MNSQTITDKTETENDYDRLAEYYAANDELRRRRWLLDNEATDENYETLWASYDEQGRLVDEIRQTVTNWRV